MNIWLNGSILKRPTPGFQWQIMNYIYTRIKSLPDTDPDIIHWVNWEQPDSWFCRLQAHHIVLFINTVL